ncbi:FimC family chaperone protein [Rahnella aquatilis CIP 78.65 = ATCC 33071]|uniref:P pilus assembly protein, chaperone PapD n=1 Tax=Rahnella aquatilis (strain ATCC 33071 / DSM 4594 / JCM 1683 / NBRC 105701 / NCIMB 13365 / CIP 78.65) TaxID=745277 RepID=H2IVA3_RAHAC|nr:fimbrial chaperone [Rahnella aquatilis]AEX50632.1 P pilus assembly protein, chaperone PapD [Rahnella aquatilis CIP 78.65 = ATCC 33071]KFD01697.1 FimC family chaperone protein [Rahnella aquatilis CIP 78.65 = ATCC 33071]
MKQNLIKCTLAVLLAAGFCQSANADLVLSGTRVIFPAEKKDVTVQLTNKGTHPLLAQSWIDAGDPSARPESVDVPFYLTPPVSRIDPEKGQTLRIVYNQPKLPKDRESVFWLNVLEIPAKAKKGESSEVDNTLQLAFRTRVKIFYRPTGLKSQPNLAAKDVIWSKVGTNKIKANNPTPYYISYSAVNLSSGAKKVELGDAMLAPFSTTELQSKQNINENSWAINYAFINDYGGSENGNAALK